MASRTASTAGRIRSASLALLTELGPRATITLADGVAVWLGFDNIVDLQLALLGETGGLFGYDGDGAKYTARVGMSVRFVPRVAREWLWL